MYCAIKPLTRTPIHSHRHWIYAAHREGFRQVSKGRSKGGQNPKDAPEQTRRPGRHNDHSSSAPASSRPHSSRGWRHSQAAHGDQSAHANGGGGSRGSSHRSYRGRGRHARDTHAAPAGGQQGSPLVVLAGDASQQGCCGMTDSKVAWLLLPCEQVCSKPLSQVQTAASHVRRHRSVPPRMSCPSCHSQASLLQGWTPPAEGPTHQPLLRRPMRRTLPCRTAPPLRKPTEHQRLTGTRLLPGL